MHVDVAKELAALEAMTVAALRVRYAQVVGEETRVASKTWLVKRVIWGLQALAEGDLSERARQRAAELAQDTNLRLFPAREKRAALTSAQKKKNGNGALEYSLPLPGTILTRWYKGKMLCIQVLRHGFEYDGQIYKSLTAVARAITNSHTSGYLFFRRSLVGEEEKT